MAQTTKSTQKRIDLFTTVHKGLRWWMAKLSTSLGSNSFTESTVYPVLVEVEEFLSALDEHALHEETCIAPYLLARATDRALLWQVEHRRLEELEGALRRQIEGIRQLGPSHGLAAEMGLALYRSFNRFAAETLCHLDEEETLLMPLLWSVCSDEELGELMLGFKARFGVEAANFHARVASAYSPAEQTMLGL